MSTVLIETPLTLDRLEAEQAVFVGSAEKTVEFTGPLGMTGEGTYHFPLLAIGRENWEALGRPTRVLINVVEL